MTISYLPSGKAVFLSVALVILLAIWGVLWIRVRRGRDAHVEHEKPIEVQAVPLADQNTQALAVERLLALPQFHRSLDGAMIDWSSGAVISTCDCDQAPRGHLKVVWGDARGVGFLSAEGLEHYVRFQELRGRFWRGDSAAG